MSVASTVIAGRAAAEARMLDRCTLKRPTGRTTQDETTGAETPEYTVIKTNVPCRVKISDGLSVRTPEVGGRTAAVVVRTLHISVKQPETRPGDVAEMTSIHATSDPTLAGATLVLDGPAPGSQTTARRLQVSEVIA